ncbi:MAG: YcaQ family DNA glycosylase [Ardenticatenaceae bacterium]|nr:YcaQ family DNA glycosylase [Ardenticatenaceae bacterium]MCB9443114.1 YcaQ family DNA glycosylase [Ardenticatenaceae bacterium]
MTNRTISPNLARRVAVASQQLSGPQASSTSETILSTIQNLGCLQIDPINVVARSPLLVLWSRLGAYNVAGLETLLWDDKHLFEYWAHAASIVLTNDFPLHQLRMVNYVTGEAEWEKRYRRWMKKNKSFHQYILEELSQRGPLLHTEMENRIVEPWPSSGWNDNRNMTMMLQFMWMQGEIMVARRFGEGFGLKKQWALAEHHLPEWMDHEPWSQEQVVTEAAQKSLRALGMGTAVHIENHFIRGRYPGLRDVLETLKRDGRIHPIHIHNLPGDWYIHDDTLPLLEQLENGDWQPRTTLLSPFDNLICDRDRTELLFNFYYRSEIYTPKAKRQYGYYVMPILHGEQLIGRVDPQIDRKTKTLHVHAIHAEPDAPQTKVVRDTIRQSIEELAQFLGAKQIAYGETAPEAWQLS